METVVLIVAIVTLLHLLYTSVELHFGLRSIFNLTQQVCVDSDSLPVVSIIFSALNEESQIEDSLKSMQVLNYPQLEIIAINDRSTDQTGILLDRLAQHHPNLLVIHLNQLPANWLGKNHALYIGALQAKGEWLLFTDADVIMKEDLLHKALSYVMQNKLDHLTIYEKHLHKPFWLKVLSLGSYTGYTIELKPWRVRYRWSKKYLGHGAFNLVKKTAYKQCGGHAQIALECLDDMKLGELLKVNGYRQDTVNGRDLIEREWYGSLKKMVHGLSKNAFAYFNFKLSRVCGDFVFGMVYFIWPIVALTIFSGPVVWINLCNIGLMLQLNLTITKHFRLPRLFAFFYPLGIILVFYTIWYAVYQTYRNNGIIWRDTFYLLDQLKRKPPPAPVENKYAR